MENKTGTVTHIESLWPPKGFMARTIHGLTRNGGVTKDLLGFLRKETPPPLKAPHEDKEMPADERVRMEEQRKEAIKNIERFSVTHDPDDLGFPPEFFEASGKENVARSHAFYAYAIALAKEIKLKSF